MAALGAFQPVAGARRSGETCPEGAVRDWRAGGIATLKNSLRLTTDTPVP